MRCEDVLLQLWEYLDEELAPEEARTVRAHLGGCPSCHPVYRCDRAFLELLSRQHSTCTAPDRLVLHLRKICQS